MHIRKRSILLLLPFAVAGLIIGAAPALAHVGGHAATPSTAPIVPVAHQVNIAIFTAKEQVPTPTSGVYTTTMVPYMWGVDAGQPALVTVYNYDASVHTITAPDLKIAVTIKAGTPIKKPFAGETDAEKTNGVIPARTRFVFTAPTAGAYAWHSESGKDSSYYGMSGYIFVN